MKPALLPLGTAGTLILCWEMVQSAWIRLGKPAVRAVKLIPNLPVTRPGNYSCQELRRDHYGNPLQ